MSLKPYDTEGRMENASACYEYIEDYEKQNGTISAQASHEIEAK